MNPIDESLLGPINSLAGRSWALDRGMVWLSQVDLVQGSVALAAIWHLWFRNDAEQTRRREGLLAALGAGFLGLAVGRLGANLLPFRHRPIHEPGLDLVLPMGMSQRVLEGHSTFPSDHATLAFAIAAGVGLVSKPAGALLLFQATFLICLPRVYLGLHYPTDIIGGAILGTLSAWALSREGVHRWYTGPMLGWEASMPSLFYPALILISIQLASMVAGLRALLSLIVTGSGLAPGP